MAAVGVISFVLIVARRPDAIFYPQFYAEDGKYFYAQAYNLGGLHALTIPLGGYLITSDRVAGLFAVLFPLSWGPAIINVLAIGVECLPAVFLFSDRFDHLIPNWYARVALAFLYLALPNAAELDAVITNSQWHLALLVFLVIIAAPPSGARWKVFDGVAVLLTGLSGPFCIMLAPIILVRWLKVRNPFLLRLLVIDFITTVVQIVTLVTSISSGRAHAPLGISGIQLVRIIVGQVFLASMFGPRGYSILAHGSWWATWWFPLILLLAAVAFLGLTLRRAPQELHLLWLFGALVFIAALFAPLNPVPGTYWQALAHPGWDQRYEFFLIVAWMATLVWALSACPRRLLRGLALVLTIVTCLVGIPVDWRYMAFSNYHYQSYVREFQQLPVGSRIVIPINPDNSEGWAMTLIKH